MAALSPSAIQNAPMTDLRAIELGALALTILEAYRADVDACLNDTYIREQITALYLALHRAKIPDGSEGRILAGRIALIQRCLDEVDRITIDALLNPPTRAGAGSL